MHRTQHSHIMQVIANLILLIDSVRIHSTEYIAHHILTLCVNVSVWAVYKSTPLSLFDGPPNEANEFIW
jgi:hypothetical protein